MNLFTVIFECLIHRNPGIWSTVFCLESWLCCALLTFILNPITSLFHYFGKAADGIFEHLPIRRGITSHLFKGTYHISFQTILTGLLVLLYTTLELD